jgi:PfaD family protein
MGAAYVLLGSVMQACRESGSSDAVREMLAAAEQADVTMAPAADMFELGVEVQVLRRGTLFAQRARRLYELYRGYDAIEALPADIRLRLERELFRADLDEIWHECELFWSAREPAALERAERDRHHRMALVFRWYLGKSTQWAREGVADRQQDFQIWCGPGIGSFNAWTAGSHLAQPAERTVASIGLNLLAGAVRVTRAQQLRAAGVALPDWALTHAPQPTEAAV